MPPPDAALTDLQVAVFSVPRRVVLIKRGTGIALGAYGLVMIALFYPWHDPLPPDSIDHIVWPMLALGVAALLAFIWLQWKRIPPGAPGGTLQIGPGGIAYRVGPDQVRLGWSQIAGVTPIAKPSKRQVGALWLQNEDPAPPNSSRMTLLQIAHAKSPYRPVERPDGVLLPIGLFGQAAAEAIIHALGTHLEAQGRRS